MRNHSKTRPSSLSLVAVLFFLRPLSVPISLVAEETREGNANRVVEIALVEARDAWEADTNRVDAAWILARAAFDCAEVAESDDARRHYADEGAEAARQALALDGKSAAGHYYLAMNLGQEARTRRLGALKLVDRMEDHFTTAATLDPAFDHAGPHRNLGLLYREAPGWPVSIGNRKKAEKHLQKAFELAPDYPANSLELLQARVDWKEWPAALKQLETTRETFKTAREVFIGKRWEADWRQWEKHLSQLEAAIEPHGDSR